MLKMKEVMKQGQIGDERGNSIKFNTRAEECEFMSPNMD